MMIAEQFDEPTKFGELRCYRGHPLGTIFGPGALEGPNDQLLAGGR